MNKMSMDPNTKSLLYNTLLGTLIGGSAASIYSLAGGNDKYLSDSSSSNRIVVPLSRDHFMKTVSESRAKAEKRKKTNEDMNKALSTFTPQELASLKKSILRNASPLRKAAVALPQQIEKKTSPVVSSSSVKTKSGGISANLRDPEGKFSTESKLEDASELKKQASWWDDVKGQAADYGGFTAGLALGTIGIKKLYDRIILNRQKSEVEKSRRLYANMVNNDIKTSLTKESQISNYDRGYAASIPGHLLAFSVGTAALSALVLYRVMERRRKALEGEADKDTSKFPIDKSIEYKFV